MSNEAPNLRDYLREAREAWASDMAIEISECVAAKLPLPDEFVEIDTLADCGEPISVHYVKLVRRAFRGLYRRGAVPATGCSSLDRRVWR